MISSNSSSRMSRGDNPAHMSNIDTLENLSKVMSNIDIPLTDLDSNRVALENTYSKVCGLVNELQENSISSLEAFNEDLQEQRANNLLDKNITTGSESDYLTSTNRIGYILPMNRVQNFDRMRRYIKTFDSDELIVAKTDATTRKAKQHLIEEAKAIFSETFENLQDIIVAFNRIDSVVKNMASNFLSSILFSTSLRTHEFEEYMIGEVGYASLCFLQLVRNATPTSFQKLKVEFAAAIDAKTNNVYPEFNTFCKRQTPATARQTMSKIVLPPLEYVNDSLTQLVSQAHFIDNILKFPFSYALAMQDLDNDFTIYWQQKLTSFGIDSFPLFTPTHVAFVPPISDKDSTPNPDAFPTPFTNPNFAQSAIGRGNGSDMENNDESSDDDGESNDDDSSNTESDNIDQLLGVGKRKHKSSKKASTSSSAAPSNKKVKTYEDHLRENQKKIVDFKTELQKDLSHELRARHELVTALNGIFNPFGEAIGRSNVDFILGISANLIFQQQDARALCFIDELSTFESLWVIIAQCLEKKSLSKLDEFFKGVCSDLAKTCIMFNGVLKNRNDPAWSVYKFIDANRKVLFPYNMTIRDACLLHQLSLEKVRADDSEMLAYLKQNNILNVDDMQTFSQTTFLTYMHEAMLKPHLQVLCLYIFGYFAFQFVPEWSKDNTTTHTSSVVEVINSILATGEYFSESMDGDSVNTLTNLLMIKICDAVFRLLNLNQNEFFVSIDDTYFSYAKHNEVALKKFGQLVVANESEFSKAMVDLTAAAKIFESSIDVKMVESANTAIHTSLTTLSIAQNTTLANLVQNKYGDLKEFFSKPSCSIGSSILDAISGYLNIVFSRKCSNIDSLAPASSKKKKHVDASDMDFLSSLSGKGANQCDNIVQMYLDKIFNTNQFKIRFIPVQQNLVSDLGLIRLADLNTNTPLNEPNYFCYYDTNGSLVCQNKNSTAQQDPLYLVEPISRTDATDEFQNEFDNIDQPTLIYDRFTNPQCLRDMPTSNIYLFPLDQFAGMRDNKYRVYQEGCMLRTAQGEHDDQTSTAAASSLKHQQPIQSRLLMPEVDLVGSGKKSKKDKKHKKYHQMDDKSREKYREKYETDLAHDMRELKSNRNRFDNVCASVDLAYSGAKPELNVSEVELMDITAPKVDLTQLFDSIDTSVNSKFDFSQILESENLVEDPSALLGALEVVVSCLKRKTSTISANMSTTCDQISLVLDLIMLETMAMHTFLNRPTLFIVDKTARISELSHLADIVTSNGYMVDLMVVKSHLADEKHPVGNYVNSTPALRFFKNYFLALDIEQSANSVLNCVNILKPADLFRRSTYKFFLGIFIIFVYHVAHKKTALFVAPCVL